MTKERAIATIEDLRKRCARELFTLYGKALYDATSLAIMALQTLSESNFPSIEVGDICRYKSRDNKDSPEKFVVTKIYSGMDGNGEIEFFFDGLYEDGSTIEDGTLCMIERVGVYQTDIFQHLCDMFREANKE